MPPPDHACSVGATWAEQLDAVDPLADPDGPVGALTMEQVAEIGCYSDSDQSITLGLEEDDMCFAPLSAVLGSTDSATFCYEGRRLPKVKYPPSSS